MNPLEILPSEMWKQVFEHVKDGQDWLNLYRSSPSSFGEVVGERRQLVLFPGILAHLVGGRYLNERTTTLSQLLSLRLVCRHWKAAVDSILRNSHYPRISEVLWKYSFQNVTAISSFLSRFGSSSHSHTSASNPILSRSLMLYFNPFSNPPEELERYKSLVVELLEKFGSSLKGLYITDFIGNRGFGKFTSRLRSILVRTPNLERLDIKAIRKEEEDEDPSERVVPPSMMEGEGEKDHPLVPRLQSLTLIWVDILSDSCWKGLRGAVLRMTANPDASASLRELHINSFPAADELSLFPNLETVTVFLRRREELVRLASCSWPFLAHLRWFHLGGLVTLRELFDVVAHFKESLTSLRICTKVKVEVTTGGGDDEDDADAGGFQVPELPRLKSLEITELLPFRLFERLDALEGLFISYVDMCNEKEPAQLVRGVETEIRGSGVWGKLPKLRKIVLSIRRCGGAGGLLEEVQRIYCRHRSMPIVKIKSM